MNVTLERLDNLTISHIFVYIEKNYGDKFYEMDANTQGGIITTYLQYRINPKRENSIFSLFYCSLFQTTSNCNISTTKTYISKRENYHLIIFV